MAGIESVSMSTGGNRGGDDVDVAGDGEGVSRARSCLIDAMCTISGLSAGRCFAA